MLPTGHIAAGYLASRAVTSIVPFEFIQTQETTLLLVGMFLAFAPDLDFFAAFAKTKRMRIENDKVNHRNYLTHVPAFWLVLGLIIFFASSDPFVKTIGLLVWVGPWTHFILDAESGIKWLWPFSKRLFPNKAVSTLTPPDLNFFVYWKKFVFKYFTTTTSLFEILIIITALIVAFKS